MSTSPQKSFRELMMEEEKSPTQLSMPGKIEFPGWAKSRKKLRLIDLLLFSLNVVLVTGSFGYIITV